ncbi:MAG: glycosyltransferase family 8 protein [Brotaphodocola sp.]
MNILYTCDDNYAWIMGVSLISLLETNTQISDLEIYLLGANICELNKELINDIAKQYHRPLHIIDIPDLEYIPRGIITHRWPLSAYIRLFSGELLPDHVNEILYLDCDTIVRGKLELNIKVDNAQYLFYGVRDCIGGIYKKNIGLGKGDIYINAGVLLINLKELRNLDTRKMIYTYLKQYGKRITYADQDILNGIFGDRIGCLPLKFNIMTIVAVYTFRELCMLRKPTNFYTEEEMKEALEDPIIIHYTTNMRTVRPWYINTNHPYALEFTKYLKMSPWVNRELKQMKFIGLKSWVLGFFEKLPRYISYTILGFIHSIIRPFIVWWNSII